MVITNCSCLAANAIRGAIVKVGLIVFRGNSNAIIKKY